MGIITIEYVESGRPVSDFEIDEWLKDVLKLKNNGETVTFRVSTSLPVYATRLAIVTGKIHPTEVQFIINGKLMTSNKYGNLWWESPPEVYNEEILKAMFSRSQGLS